MMADLPISPTMPAAPKKSAVKRALLGVSVLGGVAMGLSTIATQLIADRLGFDPALGTPWFGGFYAPWSWFSWMQAPWAASQTDTFRLAAMTATGALIPATLAGVHFTRLAQQRSQKIEGLRGTARWIESVSELREIGFLPKEGELAKGVYIGAWTDPKTGIVHYLRHDGPEHIGAIAPTRSGKGVGLVLPTLLSHPGSTVINDMKGELWGQTAGWRKEHADNVVIKFDPAAEEGSAQYNPLQEIRVESIYAVGDTQNLVTMIVDPDGKGLNDHWAKTSHAFLTGLVLHILHRHWEDRDLINTTEPPNLYDVAYHLSDPKRDVKHLYDEMAHIEDRSKENDGRRILTSQQQSVIRDARAVIAGAGRDMLNKPDNERGSVLSTAMSFLSLYRDPLVRKNISRSDFRIHDLMNHEKPVSLYLVVRPADKDRLRPLVRLVLNQIVRTLTRDELKQLPDGRFVSPHKRPLLLMLDEFAGSFGKLDIFEESLAFIAGYGMKAYVIIQDREQLLKAYGQHENIVTNLHIRIAYSPNQTETAKWISQMLGVTTIIKNRITESGRRGALLLNQVSKTYDEIERPLMTTDEVMHMRAPKKEGDKIVHPGDMLIFAAGQYAILGTQILYFTNSAFLARSKLKPPASMRTIPLPAPAAAPAESKEFVP